MAISEFRFNRRRKHPTYVFKKRGNKYHSITITHADFTRKKKNIELYKNPNPNDKRKAYLIPKVNVDEISVFDKPKRRWFFDRNDKRKVKRIKKRQ